MDPRYIVGCLFFILQVVQSRPVPDKIPIVLWGKIETQNIQRSPTIEQSGDVISNGRFRRWSWFSRRSEIEKKELSTSVAPTTEAPTTEAPTHEKETSWSSWFSNAASKVGSAIKTGAKEVKNAIVKGGTKLGAKVTRGVYYVRAKFTRSEDKFIIFVNKLKKRVENGDTKALKLLHKLGIDVDYDSNGKLSGSHVNKEASNVTEALKNEGLLRPDNGTIPERAEEKGYTKKESFSTNLHKSTPPAIPTTDDIKSTFLIKETSLDPMIEKNSASTTHDTTEVTTAKTPLITTKSSHKPIGTTELVPTTVISTGLSTNSSLITKVATHTESTTHILNTISTPHSNNASSSSSPYSTKTTKQSNVVLETTNTELISAKTEVASIATKTSVYDIDDALATTEIVISESHPIIENEVTSSELILFTSMPTIKSTITEAAIPSTKSTATTTAITTAISELELTKSISTTDAITTNKAVTTKQTPSPYTEMPNAKSTKLSSIATIHTEISSFNPSSTAFSETTVTDSTPVITSTNKKPVTTIKSSLTTSIDIEDPKHSSTVISTPEKTTKVTTLKLEPSTHNEFVSTKSTLLFPIVDLRTESSSSITTVKTLPSTLIYFNRTPINKPSATPTTSKPSITTSTKTGESELHQTTTMSDVMLTSTEILSSTTTTTHIPSSATTQKETTAETTRDYRSTSSTEPPPFPDIFSDDGVRDRLHDIFLNSDFSHDDLISTFDFDPALYEDYYDTY